MQAEVDQERLNSFLGRMLGDMGATLSAALVIVGDRLGVEQGTRRGRPDDGRGARRPHWHV